MIGISRLNIVISQLIEMFSEAESVFFSSSGFLFQ